MPSATGLQPLDGPPLLIPALYSPARWSVWTWSGDPHLAQGAGPRHPSCRWQRRAVCSCWTCLCSHGQREGRCPRPSPGWCPSCSRTPPSLSWVSTAPAHPGGGCWGEVRAPASGACHADGPPCRLWDGGGPSEPGGFLPRPGSRGEAAAGRSRPAAGAQAGQLEGDGDGDGAPPLSAELPAQ